MFAVMKRVRPGELQPIGIQFPEVDGEEGIGCAYIPLFPTIEYAEAWVKDAGYPWDCIAECGLSYQPGFIVKDNDEVVEQGE